jgi:hypothetical protein
VDTYFVLLFSALLIKELQPKLCDSFFSVALDLKFVGNYGKVLCLKTFADFLNIFAENFSEKWRF